MYNCQLKMFVCVADCGSFTKAGLHLFLSPTAVMKQINALEEHLHITLLDRTKRGVRLTAAGKSIYDDALRIFAFSREAIERAQRLSETVQRTFRVGTSMLNPCKVFMDLWHKMSDDFPQYALRIVPFEDNRVGISAEIAAVGEKFDFLVGACDSEDWLNRCNFYKMGEYRMCCAVPRGHRLAGKKKLVMEDLYGECLMLGPRGDSPSVDRARDALEKHPQITLMNTSCFYDIDVFNLCEREKSVLLTLECWQEIHPSLVTIPVQWTCTIPYGIMYPLHPSSSVVNFLEICTSRGAGFLRHAPRAGKGRP